MLNENENNPYALWAEIIRLRTQLQGPDGATWQDAATAERVRRVRAEQLIKDLAGLLRPETCVVCGEGTSYLALVEYEGTDLLLRVCDTCGSEYAGEELTAGQDLDEILSTPRAVVWRPASETPAEYQKLTVAFDWDGHAQLAAGSFHDGKFWQDGGDMEREIVGVEYWIAQTLPPGMVAHELDVWAGEEEAEHGRDEAAAILE